MAENGTPQKVDVYATAQRLQLFRLEKGWAVSYLSDLAMVPDAAIRRAEKGSFSIINLTRLAKALGESLDDVLVWRDA